MILGVILLVLFVTALVLFLHPVHIERGVLVFEDELTHKWLVYPSNRTIPLVFETEAEARDYVNKELSK